MVNVDNGTAHFRFFRPHANAVYLVGDFNDWRTDQISMTPAGDGYWQARLQLPAGVYKFRYCADGVWYTDYAAFGIEPGEHGVDSVLNISPPALVVAEKAVAGAAA